MDCKEVNIPGLTCERRKELLYWPAIMGWLSSLMSSFSPGYRSFLIMDGAYTQCISIFQKHSSRREIWSVQGPCWVRWVPREDLQVLISIGELESMGLEWIHFP